MCASFTKTLKMSSILGQTLRFFFKSWLCQSKWKQGFFVNEWENYQRGIKHEEPVYVPCIFSLQRNDGSGNWGGSIFFSQRLTQAYFLLHFSSMVHLQSLLQWQQTRRRFIRRISAPALLTLYVSSFTLLRKTKVLKLACWKISSKAASFWNWETFD